MMKPAATMMMIPAMTMPATAPCDNDVPVETDAQQQTTC